MGTAVEVFPAPIILHGRSQPWLFISCTTRTESTRKYSMASNFQLDSSHFEHHLFKLSITRAWVILSDYSWFSYLSCFSSIYFFSFSMANLRKGSVPRSVAWARLISFHTVKTTWGRQRRPSAVRLLRKIRRFIGVNDLASPTPPAPPQAGQTHVEMVSACIRIIFAFRWKKVVFDEYDYTFFPQTARLRRRHVCTNARERHG